MSEYQPTTNVLKMTADAIFPIAFGDVNINIDELLKRWDKLEDLSQEKLFDEIDGPVRNNVSKKQVYKDWNVANNMGLSHLKLKSYIDDYGTQGDYSNIIIPTVVDEPNVSLESGSSLLGPGPKKSSIKQMVILSHPEDCYAIARRHVKKQPNFTPILMDSLISTTDNDNWREQRDHYVQAFLPNASLKKVFDVTKERAKFCTQKLNCLVKKHDYIDMAEFLLHEANAQLNLGMFGNSSFYNENNNKTIRSALKGKSESGVLKEYIETLVDDFETNKHSLSNPSSAGVNDDLNIQGPLGKAIAEQDADPLTKWGNGLIFSFAGHDTTGNTMSFFCLEMAKRQDYQARLRYEIDLFFSKNPMRELMYEDLKEFPFLTRCWTETLRLWPAVPNGTYRELQYDDYIIGKNGEEVCLPKGTYVQISNWARHRSKTLWGDDAERFNPDREFCDNELWNDATFMGYNPHSERFSPFTYPPRDCIGKNFAHMEGRAILIYLFKDFKFSLDDNLHDLRLPGYYGINQGTMAASNPYNKTNKNGIEVNAAGLPLRVEKVSASCL